QVPVVTAETEGRTGRVEGQRARTRECKLGCVFTQTTVDNKGRPIREPDSTTYVGAIETAEEFGFRIYTEAYRRGWQWATIRVVLGEDRKSTRLNSSHQIISYAVFCLKKTKNK